MKTTEHVDLTSLRKEVPGAYKNFKHTLLAGGNARAVETLLMHTVYDSGGGVASPDNAMCIQALFRCRSSLKFAT